MRYDPLMPQDVVVPNARRHSILWFHTARAIFGPLSGPISKRARGRFSGQGSAVSRACEQKVDAHLTYRKRACGTTRGRRGNPMLVGHERTGPHAPTCAAASIAARLASLLIAIRGGRLEHRDRARQILRRGKVRKPHARALLLRRLAHPQAPQLDAPELPRKVEVVSQPAERPQRGNGLQLHRSPRVLSACVGGYHPECGIADPLRVGPHSPNCPSL